jgi:hypothetical protein
MSMLERRKGSIDTAVSNKTRAYLSRATQLPLLEVELADFESQVAALPVIDPSDQSVEALQKRVEGSDVEKQKGLAAIALAKCHKAMAELNTELTALHTQTEALHTKILEEVQLEHQAKMSGHGIQKRRLKQSQEARQKTLSLSVAAAKATAFVPPSMKRPVVVPPTEGPVYMAQSEEFQFRPATASSAPPVAAPYPFRPPMAPASTGNFFMNFLRGRRGTNMHGSLHTLLLPFNATKASLIKGIGDVTEVPSSLVVMQAAGQFLRVDDDEEFVEAFDGECPEVADFLNSMALGDYLFGVFYKFNEKGDHVMFTDFYSLARVSALQPAVITEVELDLTAGQAVIAGKVDLLMGMVGQMQAGGDVTAGTMATQTSQPEPYFSSGDVIMGFGKFKECTHADAYAEKDYVQWCRAVSMPVPQMVMFLKYCDHMDALAHEQKMFDAPGGDGPVKKDVKEEFADNDHTQVTNGTVEELRALLAATVPFAGDMLDVRTAASMALEALTVEDGAYCTCGDGEEEGLMRTCSGCQFHACIKCYWDEEGFIGADGQDYCRDCLRQGRVPEEPDSDSYAGDSEDGALCDNPPCQSQQDEDHPNDCTLCPGFYHEDDDFIYILHDVYLDGCDLCGATTRLLEMKDGTGRVCEGGCGDHSSGVDADDSYCDYGIINVWGSDGEENHDCSFNTLEEAQTEFRRMLGVPEFAGQRIIVFSTDGYDMSCDNAGTVNIIEEGTGTNTDAAYIAQLQNTVNSVSHTYHTYHTYF